MFCSLTNLAVHSTVHANFNQPLCMAAVLTRYIEPVNNAPINVTPLYSLCGLLKGICSFFFYFCNWKSQGGRLQSVYSMVVLACARVRAMCSFHRNIDVEKVVFVRLQHLSASRTFCGGKKQLLCATKAKFSNVLLSGE